MLTCSIIYLVIFFKYFPKKYMYILLNKGKVIKKVSINLETKHLYGVTATCWLNGDNVVKY